MMIAAGTMAILSWYIVEGPNGKPLPRWVINLGSLLAVFYLFVDLRMQHGRVLIAMGHFTMWLQILELYSKKTNRDYGLILVLSVLQMVGASVLSVSMVFGVLLTIYSVVALLTILLFQMKATCDEINNTNRDAAPETNEPHETKTVSGRGHRKQFRWLAGTIGVFCFVTATIVFLGLPRTSRFSKNTGLTRALANTVGFSEMVQLGSSPGQPDNQDVVLNLKLSHNGKNIGTQDKGWLLRGAALDQYDPYHHIWSRSEPIKRSGTHELLFKEPLKPLIDVPANTPTIEADITLRNSRSRMLFTLHPAVSIESNGIDRMMYNHVDGTLQLRRRGTGPLQYKTVSSLDPEAVSDKDDVGAPAWLKRLLQAGRSRSPDDVPAIMEHFHYAKGWRIDRERIRKFTEKILADRGLPPDVYQQTTPQDIRIPLALVQYLSSSGDFSYSLGNPPTDPEIDPVTEFIFDRKTGHCELFAAPDVPAFPAGVALHELADRTRQRSAVQPFLGGVAAPTTDLTHRDFLPVSRND